MKIDRRLRFARVGEAGAAFPASQHRRIMRLVAYVTLALGDLAGVGAGFALAGLMVARGVGPDTGWAMRPALAVLPLFLAIAIQRKPYSARFLMNRRRTTRDSMSALVTASMVAMLVVMHADQHLWRSGAIVALGTLLGCLWLVMWRKRAEQIIRQALGGAPIATIAILDDLPAQLPPDVPAIFAGAQGLRPDRNDPAALDALGQAIAGFERVIVACTPARRAAWLDVLKAANVQGEFLLPELDSLGMLRVARLGCAATAVVTVGPLDTTSRILKRLLDVAVASAALLVLWPVLLVVALAVRLDTPGPILFRPAPSNSAQSRSQCATAAQLE